MNKADLLALANKGIQEIDGLKVEVTTYQPKTVSSEILHTELLPVNEYSTPAFFGEGFHEYYTDEDCEQLIPALHTFAEKMQRQKEIATGEVKRKLVRTGETLYGKELLKDADARGREYVLRELRDENREVFGYHIAKIYHGLPDCPINCVIELDGKRYEPIWSFWLDSAYYKIKEDATA